MRRGEATVEVEYHTLITYLHAGQREVFGYSLASSFSHSNEAFSPAVTAPRINHHSHVNVFTDTFMLDLAAYSNCSEHRT